MASGGTDWDRLPEPLLQRLAHDLHLGREPGAELARRYGDHPGIAFVHDAWPALRDVWLRSDAATRTRVVASLTEAGAGDASVLGTPDGESAFLSTVPDSVVLQRVVAAELADFLSQMSDSRSEGEAEWERFTGALASSLEVLEGGQRLELSDGDTVLELAIGPNGPANGDEEPAEPVGAEAAASSVIETLRKAGVASPRELTYRASTEAGEAILLPLLGIPRARDADLPSGVVALPDAVADLRHEVEEAICLAFDLDEVHYDTDGDIPLRFGSAMIFVRVSDDSPVVRVFAPMLWEVPESSELLRAVNEINLQVAFARVAWDGRQVSVRTEFIAHPFDPMQLMAACQAVGGIADHFDDRLQGRFGGRIFFGKAVPTKDAGYEYGGYL